MQQQNFSTTANNNNNNSNINNSNNSSSTTNRLNFNRLANERKTVHVMNNKDITKHNKQLYTAAGIHSNLASNNYSAVASGINHQHNLNGPSSTLDSHSSGGGVGIGRNQTNATGSFLQKLSSKFTRR